MSFKDCLLAHVKNGNLTSGQAEKLIAQHEKRTQRYIQKGLGGDAARQAADDILKVQTDIIGKKHRNQHLHGIKQKEFEDLFKRMKGKSDGKVRHVYQTASNRGEEVKRSAYKMMDEIADEIGGGFFELNRNHELFVDGIREMSGIKTGNKEAAKVGKIIREVNEYVHSRHSAAGGIMGKRKNYFPQSHSREIIRKTPKEDWVNYMMREGVLDRDEMINKVTGAPHTDKELKEALEFVYEDIVSGGAYSAKQRFQQGKTLNKIRGGDIDVRQNTPRFIQFKDADQFLQYNEKFGTGNKGLINSFLNSVNGMSKDIGILEVMGPKPDAMSRYFEKIMDIDLREGKISATGKKLAESNYRLLRGIGRGGPDHFGWKVAQGFHNWMRSAYLGSASLSAISDIPFLAASAKVKGLNAGRALSTYSKLFVPGSYTKKLAKRAGFMANTIAGNTLSDTRFAGEFMGGGFTRTLANLTNKLSGLGAMTNAVQDAAGLEGLATIAEQIEKRASWKGLDADFRSGLEKFGFTSKDWDLLKKVDLYDTNKGAKFIFAEDIRVSDKLDPKVAADISNKVSDWVQDLRLMASNETTLSTRSITSGEIRGPGAGQPNTPWGYASRGLFMFKSFPITVIGNHLLPAIERARISNKYDHLAMTLIGTTLFGGIAIQAKDLVKGKTPQDMDSIGFWAAAMAQGGGLGLLGDFFIKDYSRFGRSLSSEMLGPDVGLIDDIWRVTKGNFDKSLHGKDVNYMRDIFKITKRNIPLGSLWYGRTLLERTILDNIERLVDPNFDENMLKREQKMMEETGQNYFIK